MKYATKQESLRKAMLKEGKLEDERKSKLEYSRGFSTANSIHTPLHKV